MRLVIDVGNTETYFALYKDTALKLGDWRVKTRADITVDEMRASLHTLMELDKVSVQDIDCLVLSCVVPRLNDLYERLARELKADLIQASYLNVPRLSFDYPEPEMIGADRLVNALAAIDKYGAPAIIVDFGTATNIDVISGQCAYLGGTIAPGLELSLNALVSHAAKLSSIEIKAPTSVIGKSTTEALQSGVMLGTASMIRGMVERIKTELAAQSDEKVFVIATGGLAAQIAQVCDIFDAVDVDLTLHGLNLIADAHRDLNN
ncbi:MAG: type III pantothenate kinase [Coriobacteriia bacterium]|nr:type III pantothenate kinase [Coriobacteriia bacterium]